jgi:hypothetical protein
MLLETGILRGDQSVDHCGRNFIEVGVDAIARIAEITPQLDTVGTVDDRSEFILRVLEIFDRRHIADKAIVSHYEKSRDKHDNRRKQDPQPFDYLFCSA